MHMHPSTLIAFCFSAVLLVSGCIRIAPPPTPTVVVPSATVTVALPTATPTGASTIPAADTAEAIGKSIDVGGRTLFLACTGEQKPTIILEAGLGADHTGWAAVQRAVAPVARVCSYDRAGVGQSDPAPTPRTSGDVVQDLHTLLENAGESGPYILVGHSFGGLHMRLFAHTYPADVIGLVLVDAVHEAWWSRAAALLPPATTADNGSLQSLRQFVTTDYADPAQTAEGIDIPATVAQLDAIETLGDTPLLVLVAGVPMLSVSGLPDELQVQLNTLLQETLPTELTQLSTQSVRISVDNSGHNIPQEQPNVIIAAINTLIDVVCAAGC